MTSIGSTAATSSSGMGGVRVAATPTRFIQLEAAKGALCGLMRRAQLLVVGWFEPPRFEALHLSTLAQQLLSLVVQYGGVTAVQTWTVPCASGVFEGLTTDDFAELLRELGRREVLVQDASGLLLHGP